MTILRWIKKTSLLGASLAIFVWSSSAGTLAFAGDPAASFQNPEITPVLSADVPSGRGLPSVLVTDPNDFLHPQALSVSSSPKTVPADQKLTTPEKDAVENQFNGLILNLIPIQIGTGGQDLDNRIFPDPGGTSAQNQGVSSGALLNVPGTRPFGSMDGIINYFLGRMLAGREDFIEKKIEPDFFVQAMPVLENVQALRDAVYKQPESSQESQTKLEAAGKSEGDSPKQDSVDPDAEGQNLLGNSGLENRFDNAASFAIMQSLIHPPSDLHPFVRFLLYKRFVNQDLFRAYFKMLDGVRSNRQNAFMHLYERDDKRLMQSGRLGNSLARGGLEALIAQILEGR